MAFPRAEPDPRAPRKRRGRTVVLPEAMRGTGPRWRRPAGVLAGLAGFWIASDLACSFVLPALESGRATTPLPRRSRSSTSSGAGLR